MLKRLVLPVILVALFYCHAAGAQVIYQRVPFASPPNPVGSGGRAVGWGSAFIAVADDATAASWNPAGLIQLVTPEASVVTSYHSRSEDLSFEGQFNVDSESASLSRVNINYASVVYPFSVGGMNMVTSLNYQRLFEFDRDLDFTVSGVQGGNQFISSRDFQQKGAMTTLTPAYAIQITPQWSMGLSVNVWGLEDGADGWQQQLQAVDVVDPGYPFLSRSLAEADEKYEISGYNFVVGTHVKIQNFTIGAVYKSSWDGDVNFTRTDVSSVYFPDNPAGNQYPNIAVYQEDQTITWPASFGVGVAYRYSDRLSLALDAYMTQWSDYVLETEDGEKLNLLAGTANQDADVSDTVQVRGGAEYLWIRPKYVFALRGGAFYDPEPIEDEINDFYGVALGGGVVYRQFVVDAAVQYKWASDAKGEQFEGYRANTQVGDMFAILSLIYHIE